MMISGLITILLLSAYGWLFAFYKKAWKKVKSFEEKVLPDKLPFISVVIAARNEAQNLPGLTIALQKQNYPADKFEVIVVNDHSTDGTGEIITGAAIKFIELGPDETGKKKAISKGVAAATGELIVVTDADCIPGPYWLLTIGSFYVSTNAVFIAAPVAYTGGSSVLSVFQDIDFVTLQGITAAGAGSGFHSMCNGANLAYRKDAFVEVNGFEGIDNIASGDDLLLMHKISKKYPGGVHYLKSEDAIVKTIPPRTWKEFYWQRIRWAGKTVHYEDKKIFYALLLVLAVNLLFFVLVIAGFFDPLNWLIAVVYLVIKTIIEISFIKPVARFFAKEKLMKWFFFLQPLHILYTVAIGLLSQLGSYQWKGRKTK